MRVNSEHIVLRESTRGQNTHEALQNVGLQSSRLKKYRMQRKMEHLEGSLAYKIDRASEQRDRRRAKR